MRVLVVSQLALQRRRAVSGLQLAGDGPDDVDVTEADGPWTARRALEGDGFDVLVIDGDLEPMGGFSLLYELRQDAVQAGGEDSAPAVVLTTRGEDDWLADWAGANRTLRKPVDPFRLAAVVRELAGAGPAEHADVAVADEEVEEILADEAGTAGLAPQV